MSKMRFFALQELANRQPLEVTTPSNKLSDYYGSHVFDRKKMQEYLPREAVMFLGCSVRQRLEPVRVVGDVEGLCPTFHAVGNQVCHFAVDGKDY